MIKPTGNIYYALNSKTFAIGYTVTNTCNTYTFNTPFAIPDNGTTFTTRTITVPDNVTISDVNVGVNITHTYIADVLFAVLSPANTQIDLFSRQCGSNENLIVTFNDSGAPIVCATPTQGTYAPFESLSALNGQSSAGNWIFGFNDNFAQDTGTVNSFFIEICSQQLILSTPNYGFDDFVVYPNPNNGNFTVQFSNATQNEVKIAIHDMRGRLVYDNQFNGGDSFNQNIQLNNAQAGVYLLSVTDGNRKEVKRIIIE
jgi:subtilisin-like proprotein convertase family protein